MAGASRCDGIIRAGPAVAAGRGRGFSPATQRSCAAFIRSGGSAARATGFTLIEVLLATVLLAAGLALAFATLTAATRTATRGEVMAQHSDRVRAVENFLRRRLTAARPVGFAVDEDTMLPLRFSGDEQRMRFVADLPDYLGRGGPYLHDFAVVGDGDDARIELSLAMVLAGQTVEESPPRPPELLVDGLESARFRYRGADPDGGLGDWQEQWEAVERLPLMVEVTLTDADGREWPPLVVALPLAGGAVQVGW